MMLLEDGFWRVRHFVKMKPSFAKDTIKPRPIYTVKNNQILKKYTIKGINYYLKIQLGYFW
jgi:hypothetical protein